MDRRSFLTLLGAVGALSGMPGWLRDHEFASKILPSGVAIPEDEDFLPWLAPSDLGVYGREETFAFDVTNLSLTEPASVNFERFDDHPIPVMNFFIAPGGSLTWRANSGHPIVGPVRIVMPSHVAAGVTGTDRLGRVVYASKDKTVMLDASDKAEAPW